MTLTERSILPHAAATPDGIKFFRRVYVAGPMSGIVGYNFPAFREAAEDLRSRGIDVLSPVEMDEADGLDPAGFKDGDLPVAKYAEVLSRDIQQIADTGVEAIVVLPGFENSGGARTEVAFGHALGLPVLRYPDLEPLTKADTSAAVAASEVRIVDPDTGGAKGQKPQRYDLIPPEPLEALAEVYGFGADKYDDFNYLLGYDWKLSVGALKRHIAAWEMGESGDDESGLPHLAHAAWHCFTLQVFETHGLGKDLRIESVLWDPELLAALAAQLNA